MKAIRPITMFSAGIALLFSSSLGAQTGTQTTYIDDTEHQGAHTLTFLQGASMSDHQFIITGNSGNNNNARDVLLLRTDVNGALIHSDLWGSNRRDNSNSAVLNGNTLMMAGVTNDPAVGNTNHAVTWEYDLSTNTLLNTRTYRSTGSDQFRDIIMDGGDYIGCGPVMTAVPSGREFGLARLDLAGNVAGSGAIGTAAANTWLLSAISVATHPMAPGDYFQVGYRQTRDGWFASTDNAFTPTNLVQYTNGNGCRIVLRSILAVPGMPEFWVSGYVQNCNSNIGGRDVLLMRIDQAGNILQQHVIGSGMTDDPRALRMAMNGNLIIAGTTNSFSTNGDNDIFAMEIDAGSGAVVWLKLFGSSNNEQLLGTDEVMQLFFDTNLGLEFAAIAGQQEDDLGDLDVMLITTPLLPVPDERCVEFNTMMSIVSSVVATNVNPDGTAWNNPMATNHPNIVWKPVEADLCPSFRLAAEEVDEVESNLAFQAYPNPFQETLTIELFSAEISTFKLRITDAVGRMVFSEILTASSGNQAVNVDMSTLPSGIYLLDLEDDLGQHHREKLIKK